MKTIEEFEAEVFSAVEYKKKKIKKRKGAVISVCVCICVCLTIGGFTIPEFKEFLMFPPDYYTSEDASDVNGDIANDNVLNDQDIILDSNNVQDSDESLFNEDDVSKGETADKNTTSDFNETANSNNTTINVIFYSRDELIVQKAYDIVFANGTDNKIVLFRVEQESGIKKAVFLYESGEVITSKPLTDEIFGKLEALIETE